LAGIERLLHRPFSVLGGGKIDMLGPLADDNLNTIDDLIEYAFQNEVEDSLCSFLTLNYRGHPSFSMMPSALFYFDRLQCFKGVSTDESMYWCEKLRTIERLSSMIVPPHDDLSSPLNKNLRVVKQTSWPIHFRGVIGKDINAAAHTFVGTNSWSNKEEAVVVVEIIVHLIRDGVSSQSIGVMTPFRAQVALVRQLLRKQNLGGVNVGIIEDYQGVEKDVIVLSLGRSNSYFAKYDVEKRMGLFQQPMRMNVALTRAENLLIVVGNPNAMATDRLWRQWLWFCLRNGLWYGSVDDSCGILDDYASKLRRVVRKLPSDNDFSSPSRSLVGPESMNMDSTDGVEQYMNLVVISSLEHQLRVLK